MLAIRRDDRGPARLEPGEYLRLGIGDRFHAAEVLDMRGSDRGDDGNMRADLRGQSRDLACVVHAHLEDTETAARRHPGKAERDADVVVVAAGRTMRGAAAGAFQTGEDRFLDAGLANRTGHPDDRGFDTAARSTRQRFESAGGVVDQDMGPVHRAIDDRPRRAIGEGLVEKTVAVHRFALERDEQVAIDHVAAVHLDTGDLEIMAGRSADRFRDAARVP